LLDSFQPSAIVLVCGVDTLSRDPAGSFSLTERGVCEATRMLQEQKLPLLILGGGGYNPRFVCLIACLFSIAAQFSEV
jgi:acetoin utilization deacetylase AcuC-like enzyme